MKRRMTIHSKSPISSLIISRIKQIFLDYDNPSTQMKFEFANYYRTLGDHIYFDNTDRSTVGVILTEIIVVTKN